MPPRGNNKADRKTAEIRLQSEGNPARHATTGKPCRGSILLITLLPSNRSEQNTVRYSLLDLVMFIAAIVVLIPLAMKFFEIVLESVSQ